ncbi:hypothetical protein MN116_003894 [Schistosoma mekongi]|uniref:C2H2-type domain-containing protein n=1 Tax=Schistosoma mekongi TaxID=38744 RepID=A0AAE2D677_SCHME|nr:hypothetical protein MN116_003894 [Schistosoma mekongi]
MKSIEDSSELVHLNSIPNQTVKECGTHKTEKRHSFVGNVCDVVSKKAINEFKEIQSDKQVAFTLNGTHSSLSSSSEFPQKARRSLLDWDSFINLPKKPRNLSLTTDDSLRPLPTRITASGSPVKLKQEGDNFESSCLSSVKGSELIENVKLTSLKCYTEQDRVFINNGYSFSEERSKGIFTKEEESSNLISTSYVSSGVPPKNPIGTRRRRLSLLITGSNESKAFPDQPDIISRKRNHKQVHAHKNKKSKLSPVQLCKTNETLVSVTKQNMCNGVQSLNSHIDTGDLMRFEKASCQSLSATCNIHENHKYTKDISSQILLNLTELIENESSSVKAIDGSQQNHSPTRNSLTVTHFAIQPSSLQKSPKLPKDLIATHSHGNLANKTAFHCLYCTRQFSEKRHRLKHMVACQLAPKYLTKKKLFEISRTYESSSISSESSNLVNNVDDEISISNGVICQANQTLQNRHLDATGKFVGDRNSLQIPYQNHLMVNHAIDSKSKPNTPVRSSTTNSFINSDNLLVKNPHSPIEISGFNDICMKPSEGHLFSGNNTPYESDKNFWRNYRPSYNGPYTCSFCYRVIHNRSNFARHMAACKTRISLSTVEKCDFLNENFDVYFECAVKGLRDCSDGSFRNNEVLLNLAPKEGGESELLEPGVIDSEQCAYVSEVNNTANYSLASEISTKLSKTAPDTSSSSNIIEEPLKIDHASNAFTDKSMRALEFVNCVTTGVLEINQTSETNPLTSNSTMLTGKPYSLGLRRSLSVQSDQSTPIISKLNRRENRSASPYSLRHTRIEKEISKCSRRSSVSTQSLSDNLTDDVKSVISNATTIPASDHNFKNNVPPPSVAFTCSWCSRTGFKCFRYLQIHRARCSSRPSWLNKQKPVLSMNDNQHMETPTVCEQCHREFRSIHGLKVHQNLVCHKKSIDVHDKTSLFLSLPQSMACPGCPPNAPLFESTDKLLKHLLTLKSSTGSNHTNRSQYWPTVLSVPNLGYGCHICGILLASESRLDKHKKACHEAWLFEEQQNISPNKKFSNS